MSGTYDAEQTLCQAHCSGVSVSAEGVDGFDRIIDVRMIFGGEEVVWEGRMALAWEVSESVSASSTGPF